MSEMVGLAAAMHAEFQRQVAASNPGLSSTPFDAVQPHVRSYWLAAASVAERHFMRARETARTVTLHGEVIIGGLRFDGGTYEFQRVDTPPVADPPF